MAGLVTDIFTTTFEYLQLGTGRIDEIHVIVPIGDGRFELATGYVPSYYEFWRSSGEPRLTDEEWRAILDDSDSSPLPLRPRWTSSFLVSDHISTERSCGCEPERRASGGSRRIGLHLTPCC